MKKLLVIVPCALSACSMFDIDKSLYNEDVEYLYGMKTTRISGLKSGQTKQQVIDILNQQGWKVQSEKLLTPSRTGEVEAVMIVAKGELSSESCQAVGLEMVKDGGLRAVNPFQCRFIERLNKK